MSKFKKGETSTAIRLKKENISNSLDKKNEILSKLNNIDDIKVTIPLERVYLSEKSVLEWEDESLGIIKCSRNTAHQAHNKTILNSISLEIKRINKIISSSHNNKITDIKKNQKNRILKEENEELKNVLAEVYRAYIQLVEMINKSDNIDFSIRKKISNQKNILNHRNIRGVN
ncbi:hypothetical protein [Devosia sp.]|uniref:hypothetical protein n=1 Tax=Devosia sp. TaxID=1871048 RepID=UPI003A95A72E